MSLLTTASVPAGTFWLMALCATGPLQAAEPAAAEPTAPEQDLHAAPQPTRNAPPESQFNPPGSAETSQLPPGFVEVPNPAFPAPRVQAAVVPPESKGKRYESADLAPYFANGALAAAKAAFDGGHFAKAFDVLEGQGDSPPVRYLRAISALRAGNAAFAADALAALATDYPPLRDRALTHGGVANEELGRWEVARHLFEQVSARSKLFVDARFGLSRVLRRQTDGEGAMKALAPIAVLPAPSWGRDIAAESLIAIADLARGAKDAEVEHEALLTLWSSHPLSPLAMQAEKRLKGTKIPKENQVTRGEQLIEAHRNALGMAALQPLLPVLKLPDPLACRAHFAYGKGLRKERLHPKAIEALQPVVDKCKDPELRARALYVLASSRSIVDSPHGAATYELLAKDYPSHTFADDALFFAADLYVRNGDPETALKRLDRVATEYPTGDFAAEALFKTFWILRAEKKTQQALETLDRIDKQFANSDESFDVERARYWRARMLEDADKKSDAAELLAVLALEHPATYYGLAARWRLADLDKVRLERVNQGLVFPRGPFAFEPAFAGPMGNDPHFTTGVELVRLGLTDGASTELLAVERLHLPEEALRLLVHVLSVAGDSRAAHAIARTSLRRDLAGRITEETRPIWEVAYPPAFRDLIVKYCGSAKIDPDLLQALMREESALDPKALSWAGALGLTQLMPATANAVAKANKLPKVTTQMLLEPDWNIRLGALNLGALLRKFKEVKPYAIAGYNAGDAAVNRWLSERSTMQLDEWIEEIPISETRGYVKRVLRSYNTYQLLYGLPPAPAPQKTAAVGAPAK